MISAGIDPQRMDAGALRFIDRRGAVAVESRGAVQDMLDKDSSYPVKVAYKPRKVYEGMTPDEQVTYEVTRTHLLAVKEAVAALGADMYRVKHPHQRKTFE